MHILLTDVLTCPRCGPRFGLILLADRVADRRVEEGLLGCSNCREKYEVRGGAGLLGGPAAVPPQESEEAGVMRLAALLGVTGGPGMVLVAGPGAAYASALAALVEGIEVIASGGTEGPTSPTAKVTGAVSLLGHPARVLPLSGGRVRAVALTGTAADALLEEGARVVAAGGRLVLDPAPPDAATRIAEAGLHVAARGSTHGSNGEGETIVAVRASL